MAEQQRPTSAITGTTGRIGGQVARALSGRGIPLTLLARRPDRVPDLPQSRVHAVSYDDPAAAREALAGVRTLFMVSAAESADRLEQHRTFVDAAAAAGVEHVVYTSFLGASPDATFTLARDHGRTEEHIRASGMRWTFLRDNFYADVMEEFAGEDGVIRGPGGEGRCSLVARADVVRVATAVLADPAAHVDTGYDLTGPQALSLDDVAAALTRARGRTFRYERETEEQARASRAHYGAPEWQMQAWLSTYTAIAGGGLAGVSEDVERVTGAPATPFDVVLTHPPGQRA